MEDQLRERCGSCVSWLFEKVKSDGTRLGRCRLRPELQLISAKFTACSSYVPKTSDTDKMSQAASSSGFTPIPISSMFQGEKLKKIDLSKDEAEELELLRFLVDRELLDAYGLKQARLAPKWENGQVFLEHPNPDFDMVIPIETFFNRLLLIKGSLDDLDRVLKNHPKISSQNKIEYRGYVTKIRGSLTTFNALFYNREDWFIGEGGSGEE